MKKELNYRLKKIKNGRGFYCNLTIIIEPIINHHHIIEDDAKCDGYGDPLPKDFLFYILIGFNYALERLTTKTYYKIVIKGYSVFLIEFTPSMMIYTASRLLINNFNNNETRYELDIIENELFIKPYRTNDALNVYRNRTSLSLKEIQNKVDAIKNHEAQNIHQDWKNFLQEINLLKLLSIKILPIFSNLHFKITIFEEGYPILEIYKNNEIWSEIQVADIESQTFISYIPEIGEVSFNHIL